MASKFKNASQDDVKKKLVELNKEEFNFNTLMLQGDTYWLYCNARRYWGTFHEALKEAGISLQDDIIKSDYGHKIDWWTFYDEWNQREYLAQLVKYMHEKGIDISAHGLKNSPYFDIYNDTLLLFGTYEALLSYVEIPRHKADRIGYPENKALMDSIIEMYLCNDLETRCKHLRRITSSGDQPIDKLSGDIAECPALVDGANIAYIKNVPSMENVYLIDKYLQDKGFQKENISFIFDAAFRYQADIGIEAFDRLLENDNRYCLAPAGEKADSTILAKAWELMKQDPQHPPVIITNDQYKDYFEHHPEHLKLAERKKGVTWTFILKKKEPVINFQEL